ncbi:HD domain-containing protein [Sulfodiicoccus acidiphilus]|uniref:HD domain-containing protein n=1 Tax=Sulfodiicoccus acidiphilus TaxID=1670455 RepID=UPI0013155644|nr:HD domain-containing protein [Sulfodiicoccus acidiphilus]
MDEEKARRVRDAIVEVVRDLVKAVDGLSGTVDAKVGALADSVAVIYRAPMVFNYAPIKGAGPASKKEAELVSNNFDYLVTYALGRHFSPLDEVNRALDEGDLNELLNALESLDPNLLEYVRSLRPKVQEIYEFLLHCPADTRPGLNLSSLASHMVLTSLFAWSIDRGVKLSYLRLASILHDVGKVTSPEDHVKEGKRILDEVLAHDVSAELREELRKAFGIAEKHHTRGDYVDAADDVASSADRLASEVKYFVSSKYPSLEECYGKYGKEGFDCFSSKLNERLYEEVTRGAFEEMECRRGGLPWMKCGNVKQSVRKAPQLPPVEVEDPKAYLYYFDFPGVQRFIESFPSLRDVSAASFLVDFAVSTLPFIEVDRELRRKTNDRAHLPMEAMLSGYGGHSMLVVSSELSPTEVGKVRDSKILRNLDIELTVAYSPLIVGSSKYQVVGYDEVWRRLAPQLREAKLRVSWREDVLSAGLHATCESCGLRPAVRTVEGDRLCSRCATVREVSKKRGFTARAAPTYLIDGREISPSNDELLKEGSYAMEFLAGHGREVLQGEEEGSEVPSKYVGVFKFDGNDAGALFRGAFTLGMFVDFSFKVDYAVKTAFLDTLSKLDDFMAARALAGVLYLGGDEGMMFLPSVISAWFASTFQERAGELSGVKFKGGLAVVKPDHPVQFAMQAANHLMEEAKQSGSHTLAITVASGGLLTEATLKSEEQGHRAVLRLKNPTSGGAEPSNSVKAALTWLLGDGDHLAHLRRLHSGDREEVESFMQAVRVLEDLVGMYLRERPRGKFPWEFVAYCAKEKAKWLGEGDPRDVARLHDDVLRAFLKSTQEGKDFSYPLLDLLHLAKSIRVGTSRWNR